MSQDTDMLSTIENVPLSYFVYSSLSCFGPLADGELPGMWFVHALGEAGRDLSAIRQTLYRMEAEGELEARKVGRAKLYRASRYARGEIDAGLAKIFRPASPDWHGTWTMVNLSLHAPAQRVARERVVALLGVHGFAMLGGDTYLHPRDVGKVLVDALSAPDLRAVTILCGALVNEAATPAILARWRVPQLARRYRRTLVRLERIERARAAGISDRDAFLLRFALVFDFLSVAWDDPGLPTAVLPDDWPGEITRGAAAELYGRLLEPASRFADQLLARTRPTLSTRS
jgi:phenylacetic acid degradation operon negative regulatory protein